MLNWATHKKERDTFQTYFYAIIIIIHSIFLFFQDLKSKSILNWWKERNAKKIQIFFFIIHGELIFVSSNIQCWRSTIIVAVFIVTHAYYTHKKKNGIWRSNWEEKIGKKENILLQVPLCVQPNYGHICIRLGKC